MIIEVEVDNLIDKAIIKSLKKAENGMLMRKAIIRSVMGRIDEKESVIIKRIEKMSKESPEYLINVSRGIYKLNPDIKFTFVGESLPSETKPLDISPKAREEHTDDLQFTIKNWIENLPEIPYCENSHEFYEKVERCESYPLFNDLSNHLPETGYDICQQWTKIKKGVKEEDKRKDELFELIKKNISYIFQGLNR